MLTTTQDSTFEEDIKGDKPVLVDFWAPWCGPCRALHPVLEEIAKERDDIQIISINVDDNQQTAAKHNVQSIPTMILFQDGEMIGRLVGAMPRPKLEAEIDKTIASKK